jgi:hypothetical protein
LGDHRHGQTCGGLDHHRGNYTSAQRADLHAVLAFNRRMATAVNEGKDTGEVERLLDPDPLRYMWVDEGQGQLRRLLAAAQELLERAPHLPGHVRTNARPVSGSHQATRPTVAAGPAGELLCCWLEWLPGQGDQLKVISFARGLSPLGKPSTLPTGVTDLFRPTAVYGADGRPWVFFGRSAGGEVGIWGTRHDGETWTSPERVTTTGHPSFNQEVAAHADGRLELCWQGLSGGQPGIWSRVWHHGRWQEPGLVSTDARAGVWDPAIAAFADGTSAYAWCEYRDGSYQVMVATRDPDGRLDAPRPVTGGGGAYALHPSLAVTGDQHLWCAFDLVTVPGHGDSGPTKLRPHREVAVGEGAREDAQRENARETGPRETGQSIPAELLPEISSSIRVVRISPGGAEEAPGELAPHLPVAPAGLPRLVTTGDGGLAVSYRIRRRLPLMTYYWEVAAQVLGRGGWQSPVTLSGTDATLEEPGLAPSPEGGFVVAARADGRLERGLDRTEGFGGRECPYLLEHHGAVAWHGVHGVGTVTLAELAGGGAAGGWKRGPAAAPPARAQEAPSPHGQASSGGRRTPGNGRPWDRYTTMVGGKRYTLYWGDLHRHSLISRCTAGDEPSLHDSYRYARDVYDYDFWALTDHSENTSDYQWWAIQKTADLFHVPGQFIPLYGFEWTSAETGHQNVIYGDVPRGAPIFSAFAAGTTDPAGLWEALARHPEYPAITIPHHPGSAMVNNDWDYHDPRYSRLVEVFQACRGNYEADGAFRQYSDATKSGTFMIDGLLRGHKFGLIASSDHGYGASYVGAYCESLDRSAVFDALRQRRTFAATTRDLIVDFRIGEAFLGQEARCSGELEFSIHAAGYTDLARVDIVRNGEVAHSLGPVLNLPTGWLTVPLRLEWGMTNLATRWDGTLSMSGGEILQTPYWSPEITSVSTDSLSWSAETRSFGDLYGAQRGGIELTVTGPPGAEVLIDTASRSAKFTLAELSPAARHELPGSPGRFTVQPGVGGLTSLGFPSVALTWSDHISAPAFYYVRVFQVDGEMAWSSPIWITPTGDLG